MSVGDLFASKLFQSKVSKPNGDDACWLWTGQKNPAGYGKFLWQGPGRKRLCYLAHRVSLFAKLGHDLTPDRLACHTCDNPPCVNPAHLFEGDKWSNMADMVAKGRSPSGARHAGAKLSESTVGWARFMNEHGHRIVDIARYLEVSPATISALLNGRRWSSRTKTFHDGVTFERAAIVAWLRSRTFNVTFLGSDIADAIERGEHEGGPDAP